MKKYPISFYDANGALRTGLTSDEDWNENGFWIDYQGERIFVKLDCIRNEPVNKVRNHSCCEH